ncbi:MAG: hypothetical protein IJ189_00880 [Clostridia bacterium]|nr:hypothetical protein [Clostridia bacterium]
MLVNNGDSQEQHRIALKNLPEQTTLIGYIYRESERKMKRKYGFPSSIRLAIQNTLLSPSMEKRRTKKLLRTRSGD